LVATHSFVAIFILVPTYITITAVVTIAVTAINITHVFTIIEAIKTTTSNAKATMIVDVIVIITVAVIILDINIRFVLGTDRLERVIVVRRLPRKVAFVAEVEI